MHGSSMIFFDGHCHLCCSSVQFVLKRDRSNYFQYAPIDGVTATSLFHHRKPGNILPDSIVLYEKGQFYTRSTAALRVARKLSGGWPLLYVFIVIPTPLRNWVYNIIAKNRYRWFGKLETCWMPKPEWKERFLN